MSVMNTNDMDMSDVKTNEMNDEDESGALNFRSWRLRGAATSFLCAVLFGLACATTPPSDSGGSSSVPPGTTPAGREDTVFGDEIAMAEDAAPERTPAAVDRLQFVAASAGLPSEGLWRNNFDIADMNGDGALDIVTGPAREGIGVPHIFLGDGKGKWRELEAKWPDGQFDYGGVRVGDFDGDGTPDLALACHFLGLRVLRGDGKGTFTSWGTGLPWRGPFTARGLATGDFDEDGRLDIAAIIESPQKLRDLKVRDQPFQRVYLNRAGGSFVESSAGLNPYGNGDFIETADFNADRHLDLIVSSFTFANRTLVYLGDGKGGWTGVNFAALEPDSYTGSVAAGDLNGDGRSDLVVGYMRLWQRKYNPARSVLGAVLSQPDGGWQLTKILYRPERHFFRSMATGDLNRDGRLDIVAVYDDSRVYLLLANAKGSFDLETEPLLEGPGGRPYCVRLADLNGDGKLDVAAGFGEEVGALLVWMQK